VQQVLIFAAGGVVLLVTWLVLYVWIRIITQVWLAPWCGVPASQQPPVGTWQRTLNDYFARLPGAILPVVIVLTTSAFLFLVRLVRGRNRAFLPLEFAALNLSLMVAYTILVLVTYWLPDLWLPQPRPSPDIGYHRTWPEIVVTTYLLLVLFRAQAGGWLKKWLRIRAIGGAIIGTTVGAMLLGALGGVITLVKGGSAEIGEALLGTVFGGILLGAFIGAIVGAIAEVLSRVLLGAIIGAVIGAIIGGLSSGKPMWALVEGIVGMIVGMIAGAKWEIE
jgi:hypothetical protein